MIRIYLESCSIGVLQHDPRIANNFKYWERQFKTSAVFFMVHDFFRQITIQSSDRVKITPKNPFQRSALLIVIEPVNTCLLSVSLFCHLRLPH